MTRIKSDVAYDVMNQFEGKIEQADLPPRTEEILYEKIAKLIEEIEMIVDDMENEIDQTLYEYSDQYIKDEMDDRITQDYLERSLFE